MRYQALFFQDDLKCARLSKMRSIEQSTRLAACRNKKTSFETETIQRERENSESKSKTQRTNGETLTKKNNWKRVNMKCETGQN